MKYICSLITVESIERSRPLYERVLKQCVKIDYGDNLAFESGFALHQKEHFKSLIHGQEIIHGSNSFELYFEDDNILGIQATLKSMGLKFVHEAREQPWRQLVIRFYDYDENLIEIGECMEHVAYRLYQEGKTIDEIAKITYLENDIILKSINSYKTVG
jgi:hypothetical protein